MILQTHPKLNKRIQDEGCYFMSLLFLANKKAETPLSLTGIEGHYTAFVKNGYMDTDCYMKNPVGAFSIAGLEVVYNDRHDKPSYMCSNDQIEILCFVNPGTGYKHFVAGDGRGHVAYDPMGDSETVKNGYLESKRVFTIIS